MIERASGRVSASLVRNGRRVVVKMELLFTRRNRATSERASGTRRALFCPF